MEYLEPYCGAASVLFNKNPSVNEVINDIDEGAINIFKMLRFNSAEFIAKLKKLKYSADVFKYYREAQDDTSITYLDQAVGEYVLRRMSRDGLKKAFAWSDRKRGGQPGDVNAWMTALDMLPKLATRLESVFVLNKPAVDVIKVFNDPNCLLYCDPPYLPETRVSKAAYNFEMTKEEHEELAAVLLAFKGKAIISGYPSATYNKLYKGWKCVKRKIANHSSQQKTKQQKTECIWKNF